jgi:restriction system protein
MPRYWVIAPVESNPPELFKNVWQFDVAHKLISIGWSELGDTSQMTRETLSNTVAAAYPDKPPPTRGLIVNMFWSFYHEISEGDFVVARRGQKILAAVGNVLRTGFYEPGRNPFLASSQYSHSNFLEVEWHAEPCDKVFPNLVFPRQTLTEIKEDRYNSLLSTENPESTNNEIIDQPTSVNQPIMTVTFALERYLQEHIVSNFNAIFKGKLHIYDDGVLDGWEYPTEIGKIDILAFEPESNSFNVIELKKGRSSDQVVGQILRYMGWVKKHLCKDGQGVKGLVICHDSDLKLSYALEMTGNIDIRYYKASFSLHETPEI